MKLKKCPFCGTKNVIAAGGTATPPFVRCNDCGATGPTRQTYEEAIEAWNRRTKNKRPWTKNEGKCPPTLQQVQVKLACGTKAIDSVETFSWNLEGRSTDITHWRLAK